MSEQVKLLLSWNIKPNQEATTFEFMAQEMAPAVQRMGITPTEAWYTVYGDQPQILVGAISDDIETLNEILEGEEWGKLMERLSDLVEDFHHKIVQAGSRFQF